MVEPPKPTRRSEPVWIEPYPDVLLDGLGDVTLGPEARYEAAESISLAFVTALHHLPPWQRAVLILRDVLGFPTREVARILDETDAAVNGALQRARATLRNRLPEETRQGARRPRSKRDRDVIDLFAAAVQSGDTQALLALLELDAWLTMPPEPYEYQGRAAIARFLNDRGQRRGAHLKLVPTGANGQPAFGCYLPDSHTPIAHAYGLMVLTVRGDFIAAITWFGDRGLMARFGLPRTLPT
jgi:RNA polymerase sigma-70 factor (ECF subfamily)